MRSTARCRRDVAMALDVERRGKRGRRSVAEQALGKVPWVQAPWVQVPWVRCTWPIDVPLNQDGSVFARMTVKELAALDTQELCDRLGLRPIRDDDVRLRADGDVQKDWKSVDVVALPSERPQSLGVICKAGPNVPDGVARRGSGNAAGMPRRWSRDAGDAGPKATVLVNCEDAAGGAVHLTALW
eukprot:Skav217982  [mRNA]  locus=scaffold496:433102:439464:- [translate_table: standard]